MKSAALGMVLGMILISMNRSAEAQLSPITPPTVAAKEKQTIQPTISPKETLTPQIPKRPPTLPESQFTIAWIDGLIDLYGGAENLRVAIGADQIELMKLTRKKQYAIEPGDFLEGRGVPLSVEDWALLHATLTSAATFNWKEDYDCIPSYSFRVKFRQKDRVVSVDLCLACRTLRVVREGREIASKNFEFGFDTIIRVVEHYYPGTIDKVATGVEGL